MKTWGCPGGLLHGYTVVSRLVAAMKRDRLSTTRPRGTRRRRARAGQELQASTTAEENVRAKCANLPWGSRGPHSPRKQYLAIGRWRSFYLFNPGPSQKSGIDRATTRPRGVRRRRRKRAGRSCDGVEHWDRAVRRTVRVGRPEFTCG